MMIMMHFSGTLAEFLIQFVDKYRQYKWEIKDEVVNIYPSEKFREFLLPKILEVEIQSFSIRPKTSCWTFERQLSEIAAVKQVTDTYGLVPAGLNFTGVQIPQLGRNFALDVSSVTVRSLLNRVV